MVLTVADLFSGCGGFSLGFEWASFDVVYALDIWDVACKSYKMNFPRAEVVCKDALTVDPSEIPDVDIIIGGPPCQAFSTANLKKYRDEEGNYRADIRLEDFDLVNWFLKVIEEKQPEYWIMENLTQIRKYLPSNIMKNLCKMCDYGVPQIRRRLFAGNYIEPLKSPTEIIFPAVLATEYKTGYRRYLRKNDKKYLFSLGSIFGRTALIPECLLIQTFPLDYQLVGTLKERYIQVGNAVPPLMAYRLADAIQNPHVRTLQQGQEALT